jgi:hypothetical protein
MRHWVGAGEGALQPGFTEPRTEQALDFGAAATRDAAADALVLNDNDGPHILDLKALS